ncbi:MAG: YckD family protein [Peptococcaceae bacterium]|nr:YckD family protein [Peptococcaceae bacterium]
MRSGKWRFGVVLLAVVVLAGAVAGVAHAQSGQPQGDVWGNLYQNFVSKLAANLGVDQNKVTAALDATRKQMLDEAVQEGKLTQEQADKIASGKDLGFGMFGFHPGRGHGFMGEGFKGRGPKLDDAAAVLGITVDQLQGELQSGKNMEQIVTGYGMTMEQFQQKMLDLKKEAVAKAVSDGKMSQEQADRILQHMEQWSKK